MLLNMHDKATYLDTGVQDIIQPRNKLYKNVHCVSL